MNLTYQDGQYVGMTRSGRRYVGRTAEEAERKYLLAVLHLYSRQIGREMFYDLLAANYTGRTSIGDLTLEEMRELRTMVDDATRYGKKMEQSKRLEPSITEKQRKRIVRLGRYVLGERYGKDWFWKKLPEWTRKNRLEDLTNREAWYVIRRLEKIEARLAAGTSA